MARKKKQKQKNASQNKPRGLKAKNYFFLESFLFLLTNCSIFSFVFDCITENDSKLLFIFQKPHTKNAEAINNRIPKIEFMVSEVIELK